MELYYVRSNEITAQGLLPVGGNLYAQRDEWEAASAESRHRALVVYFARRLTRFGFFSGISGAVMRGIPILGQVPLRPQCWTGVRRGKSEGLLQWHYAGEMPACDRIDGAWVANVERVLADLCTEVNSDAALVALNHCVHCEWTSVRGLADYLEAHPSHKGNHRLRRLLPFACGGCASPLETIGWLALYRHRFVMPEQQVMFRLPGGGKAFVDMLWRKARGGALVVELDGLGKYCDHDVLVREKRRQDALTNMGVRLLRFTWGDVRRGDMVRRLREVGLPMRRNFGRVFPEWDASL